MPRVPGSDGTGRPWDGRRVELGRFASSAHRCAFGPIERGYSGCRVRESAAFYRPYNEVTDGLEASAFRIVLSLSSMTAWAIEPVVQRELRRLRKTRPLVQGARSLRKRLLTSLSQRLPIRVDQFLRGRFTPRVSCSWDQARNDTRVFPQWLRRSRVARGSLLVCDRGAAGVDPSHLGRLWDTH